MNRARLDQLLVYCLFVVIVFAYLIMAIRFPMAYIWATYEDLFGEWMQFWLFVAAMIFSARLAFAGHPYRLFFGILALCCFYVVGEEISWGQRVLDIPTPEFFKKHNIQKEINIHNLFTGPIATSTKVLIEYALALGLVLYGVVYPLILRLRWRFATWVQKRGLAPPPIYLWPFFVTAALLDVGIFGFNEAEIAEILVSFSLTVLTIHYWIIHRLQLETSKSDSGDIHFSRRSAVYIWTSILVVIIFSLGSTYLSYASPSNRERIENRILNGIEKFAKRYARYEQWDTSARLYLLVYEAEPHRSSILRKLANCYREMGDEERFNFYNTRVLEKDLKLYERIPGKISLNLSLARTYRQRGDEDKTKYHLQRAQKSALRRVKKKPNSASTAYWLGKTYEAMGNNAAALEQFRRASELEPYKIKYKKAVIRTLAAVESVKSDSED